MNSHQRRKALRAGLKVKEPFWYAAYDNEVSDEFDAAILEFHSKKSSK